MSRLKKSLLSGVLAFSMLLGNVIPTMASDMRNAVSNSEAECSTDNEDISVGGEWGDLLNGTIQNNGAKLDGNVLSVSTGDSVELAKLKASVASDYEEYGTDRMEILDEEGENFCVYQENVVRIMCNSITDPEHHSNCLVNASNDSKDIINDEAKWVLTFSNAEDNLKAIEAGQIIEYRDNHSFSFGPKEVICPHYGKVIYKIESAGNLYIGIDNNIEMCDVFSYVKINKTEDDGDYEEALDDGFTASISITPTENVDSKFEIGDLAVSTSCEDGYNKYTVEYSKEFGGGDDESGADKGGSNPTELGGEFGIGATIGLDFDCNINIALGNVDISVTVGYTLDVNLSLEVKASMKIQICSVTATFYKLVNLTFKPSFIFEISGAIEGSLSLEDGCVGFTVDLDNGFQNKCKTPELKMGLSISASITLGVEADILLNFISEYAIGVKGSAAIKFTLSGGIEFSTESNENTIHLCNSCLAGSIGATLELDFGITGILDDVIPKLETEIELYSQDWYSSSIDGHQFRFGKCPHILYKTEIHSIKGNSGIEIGDVTVTLKVPTNNDDRVRPDTPKDAELNDITLDEERKFSFTTNGEGIATFYLPEGEYTTSQTNNGNWEGSGIISVYPKEEDYKSEKLRKEYVEVLMKNVTEIVNNYIRTIDGAVYYMYEDESFERVLDTSASPINSKKIYSFNNKTAILDANNVLWIDSSDGEKPTGRKVYFTKLAENVDFVLENNMDDTSNFYATVDGYLYNQDGVQIEGIRNPKDFYTYNSSIKYYFFVCGSGRVLYELKNGNTTASQIMGIYDIIDLKYNAALTRNHTLYLISEKYVTEKVDGVNKSFYKRIVYTPGEVTETPMGTIIEIVNSADYSVMVRTSDKELRWLSARYNSYEEATYDIYSNLLICENAATYASGLILSNNRESKSATIYDFSNVANYFGEWEELHTGEIDKQVHAINGYLKNHYDAGFITAGQDYIATSNAVYHVDASYFANTSYTRPRDAVIDITESYKLNLVDASSEPYYISKDGLFVVDDEQNIYYKGKVIDLRTAHVGNQINLNKCTITPIPNQTYNEKNTYSTAFTITNPNGETLVENKDYKVTLGTMEKAGDVEVKIEGLGDYAGTVYNDFKITPKTISAYVDGMVYFNDNYQNKYLDENGKLSISDECIDFFVDYRNPGKNNSYSLTLGKDFEIDSKEFISADGYIYLKFGLKFINNYAGTYYITMDDYICHDENEYSLDWYQVANTSGDNRKLQFNLKTSNIPYAYNYPNDKIEWNSSNTSVATIDSDGVVSFHGIGITIISASYKDNYGIRESVKEYTLASTQYDGKELAITPTVSIKNDKVNITWEKRNDARAYIIRRYDSQNGTNNIATITNINTTNYIDTTAVPGQTYLYYVDIQYINGLIIKGNYSSIVFPVVEKTPSAPTIKIANTSNGVKLSWNKISEAKGYYVYRKTANSGWSVIATINSNSTLSFVDTKAASGTTYYYTMKAFNASKQSAAATNVSNVFLTTPTVKIANSSTGVKVSWNKITGATAYQVFRKTSTSGWSVVATVTGNSTISYIDTKAVSGTKYYYTVKAVKGNYYSAANSSSVLLYLAVPVSKAANDTTGVKVTWNKVSGATSYQVFRKTSNSGWTYLATVTGNTTLKYIDKKAASGTTYIYTVKAINGTTQSAVNSGTTIKYLKAQKPTVSKLSTGIKISWGKITGATSYQIFRKTSNSGWTYIKTITNSSTVSFTDTTAKKGITYIYAIKSISGGYASAIITSNGIARS